MSFGLRIHISLEDMRRGSSMLSTKAKEVCTPTAALVAFLFLNVLFVQASASSHFRYGTLSWAPKGNNKVEFTLEAAYRADYDWGARLGEQWSSDSGATFKTSPALTFEDPTGTAGGYLDPPYQLKLPTGTGSNGSPLVNGIQCVSPFDTGDSPDCGADPPGTKKPNRKTPITYTIAGVTVNAGDFIPYDNLGSPIAGQTGVACESPDDSAPDYCSPWADSYGFFFGDGTTHDVVLTLTELDVEKVSTGNFLRGISVFEHTYSNSKKDADTPYVAFFTGGNRLGLEQDSLHNNYNGRFRLEATVNIQGSNRSPIATSLPILPVPYTGRGAQSAYGSMATFQVAAFDPDTNGQAGNDAVKFYLASYLKQGALLTNAIPEGSATANWYKEEYENERLSILATLCANYCSNCPKGGGKLHEGKEFNCVDYPPWDNAMHLAHSPQYLTVEETTGVVRWETGVNPYDTDTALYQETRVGYGVTGECPDTTSSTPCSGRDPLPMGFHNLVLDVRSSSKDPCLSGGTCTEADALGHISVPLDFMVYLYPPMAMCSGDCANTNAGISTFRDIGLYGHSTSFGGGNYAHNGPGTGQCTICGGGLTQTDLFNHTKCQSTSEGCLSAGCPGYGVDEDGNPAGALAVDSSCASVTASGKPVVSILPAVSACKYNTAPVWVDEAECGTNGLDGKTPCNVNANSNAVVVAKKGQEVTFNLVAEDKDDCTELFIHSTSLYTGDSFTIPGTTNTACTAAEAASGATACPYNMVLGSHERVGSDGKSVKRQFKWGLKNTDTQATDPRPDKVEVCFYSYDNYVQSKFRCVDIMLTTDDAVYWRDDRTGLNGMTDFAGATPANGTTFYVSPGNKVEFDLDAKQADGFGPISIYLSQGTLPEGATLTDSTTVNSDPFKKTFSWTPKSGQECTYELCWMAKNSKTTAVDYAMTLDVPATIDERCYKIVVTDAVLSMSGGTHVNIPTVVDDLDQECGVTMGLWFLPKDSVDASMPLITAGYELGGTKHIVHQLNWVKFTPEVYNDGHTVHDSGSYYSLQYVDDAQGIDLSTEPIFCTDSWHHAAFTISKDGEVAVYLDGAEKISFSSASRNFHRNTTLSLTTAHTGKALSVGTVVASKGAGAQGFFYMGSFANADTFTGHINEVFVYKRGLSAVELSSKVFTPLITADETDLVAYYKFDDYAAHKAASKVAISTVSFDAKGQDVADETGNHNGEVCQSDCSSGSAHFAFLPSPTIAACPFKASPEVVHANGGSEITVKGDNFAQSQYLKCHIGDDVVPATFVNEETITCVAPGSKEASASLVTVANGGPNHSLYVPLYEMEIAMHMDTSVTGGLTFSAAFGSQATVGTWILVEDITLSTEPAIFSVFSDLAMGGQASKLFEVKIASTGHVKLVSKVGATIASSTTALTVGSWSYVALTVDSSGDAVLMVDGKSEGTGNGVSLADAKDVVIGNSGTMTCLVDEVSVWTKALTECEVSHHMWGKFSNAPFCPVGAGVEAEPNKDRVVYLEFNKEADVGVDINLADNSAGGANGVKVSGSLTLKFTTVPFLAPSFSAKKPVLSTCASTTIGYDSNARLQFQSQNLGFGPNSDFSYPLPVPSTCGEYYDYLRDQNIPFDGYDDVTVYGFGFAPSSFLKCKQGDEVIDAIYKSYDEIACKSTGFANPAEYSLAVTNDALASCGYGSSFLSVPTAVEAKEAAMSFAGSNDYVYIDNISSGLNNTGVTFGAWFYPNSLSTGSEGVLACFADACNATTATKSHICAMYQNGQVYLQSDLPDTPYGDLDFSNVTLVGKTVTVDEWHYFEVSVEPREMVSEIASDLVYPDTGLPKGVTMKASLTVDGNKLAGDIRVPGLPVAGGRFFVGGMECEGSSVTLDRSFKGLVDEVRIFAVPNYNSDWTARLTGQALSDVFAYYRFNAQTGESSGKYTVEPAVTSVPEASKANSFKAAYIKGAKVSLIEAPWEPLTLKEVDVKESALISNSKIATVTGFNVAKTQSLKCVFAMPTSNGTTDVTTAATYVSATSVTCPIPSTDMPGVATMQAGNPAALGSAPISYRDSVLDFEGDVVKNSKVVGGTANEDQTLTMTCPAGLRMDKVEFASFGNPTVGNDEVITNCDGTTTTNEFDFSTYAKGSCYSDDGQAPYFTKDVVEKYCLGKAACSIEAKTSIFGDPCPGNAKWLSAAVRCSDRYLTKDYVEANGVAEKLTGSEYSFGAWVYPRTKSGIQAILSFGSKVPSSVLNAGVLQFKSDGAKGVFYYYDDCIYDVAAKGSDGQNLEVEVNEWYHVMVTISSSNEGSLYVDGVKRAHFSTTCRPKSDGTGSFVMGMDMDDLMYPKEYFDGLMDEVRVYDRALTGSEVSSVNCFSSFNEIDNLVSHFNFNNGTGTFATDVVGNVRGTFSASSDGTNYDTTAQSFVGSDDTHASYTYAGVPWFPATLTKVSSSSGMLRGGNTITLEGVNFAKGSSVRYETSGHHLHTIAAHTSDKELVLKLAQSSGNASISYGELSPRELVVENDMYQCQDKINYGAMEGSGGYSETLTVEDLQSGLTCWFPLVGGTGDVSGNGNDAAAMGNATLTTSRNGVQNAAYEVLDGSHIDVHACNATAEFVAMWVRYGEAPFPTTCSEQKDYGETIGYPTCIADTGKSHSSVVPHAWKFVAGTKTKTYVNGELVSGHSDYSHIIHDFFDEGVIKGCWDVTVDDVWVYDRELLSTEVAMLYEQDGYALQLGDKSPLSAVTVPYSSGGTPAGSKGLLAQVFGGAMDYNYVLSKVDLTWGTTNFNDEIWSFNASGYVYAPSGSLYTFYVTADDGVQLSVAGSVVVHDADYAGSSRTVTGTMDLAAGWHPIEVLYTDKSGDASLRLEYSSADGAVGRQVIPSESLRAGTGPITIGAWIKPDKVSGLLSIASQDDAIDFSINDGSLSASLNVLDPSTDCSCGGACMYREHISLKSDVVKGEWQHVAVSYDGKTMSFFVNGILTEQKTFAKEAMVVPNAGNFAVGTGFSGLLYDFSVYTKAVAASADMTALTECLPKSDDDLSVYLSLNEGVGSYAENVASGSFASASLVAPAWVPSACGTYGASAATTEVKGTALSQMLAGQCGLVTISAHDKCGSKLKSGGDNVTFEIIGPLHVHTNMITLTPGNGITDLGDGSYLVNITLEDAGYYKLYAKLDGVDIKASGYKTYVHPFVTDPAMSYIFDDVDPLGIKETETSFAGVPVTYTLQTVDAFGNLRTSTCDTDGPQVTFEGPVPFVGATLDNMDGTYSVTYNAQVTGKYRMAVTAANTSVCQYGGYTCAGGSQSSTEFCTLAKPASGGDCKFCVDVMEGSSLSLSGDSTFATFPDSDDLDLVSGFTIMAHVKKTGSSGYTKEYIVSKQSEHSGKGYWFALLPLGGELHTLEAGVYVGSETFRIAKASVTLSASAWAHLSVTYDGTKFQLFMDGALLTTTSFDDEEPKFQRRSSQAVHVGKYFKGLIDNVMIYSDVIADHQATALCPQNVKFVDDKLVGYYRFNEGYSHVTKDSSRYSNDGIIGLVCDKATENKAISLKCPAGHTITEVLYANFGENDGGCGSYVADCATATSAAVVEAACLNKESCSVTASTAVFGNTCKGRARSLAVNAVCSSTTSAWSTDTAPTNVGNFKLDTPECPYSDHIQNKLPESMRTSGVCTSWDMGTAVAGEAKLFAATVSDVCGYPGYAPPSDFALTSEITFQGYLDTSIAATCPSIATTTPATVSVNSTFAGSDEPCGRFGDVYLFSYMPTEARNGQLTISSGGNKLVDSSVSVVPGAISAKNTVVKGHLMAAEAGVPTTIVVEPKDAFGNAMVGSTDYSDVFQYSLTDSSGNAYASKVTVEKEAGQTYKFTVTYPEADEVYLALYVGLTIMEGFPKTVTVSQPQMRQAVNYGAAPAARFEHTMESHGSNIYVFGGATQDGSYAGDTWKWNNADVDDDWKYRRTFDISGLTGAYVAEFTLHTKELINEGKMKPDCSDILFLTAAGVELDYFMAPRGRELGCHCKKGTTVYVSLPSSAVDEFHMYYGNHKKSTVPTGSIFDYFEDFEGDALPAAFSLETDTCATAGDISGFTVSTDVSVTGTQSLKVDAETTIGGSIKHVLGSSIAKFRLRYYFFDTLCDGIHFLSPDFEACTSLGANKVDSSSGSAAGVFSSSTPDKYAYSSPWKAGSADREGPRFNLFSLVDDDSSLTVTVNGAVTATMATTDLDKIFVRGVAPSDKATGSVGYYDTIMATSYDPAVSVSMGAEEAVSFDADAGWQLVGAANAPPKRQAHASAVYSDSMYVFGGERSAYFYSDLWRYEFASDAWTFIPVKNTSSALGRYDHTAVVYGDCLYVYGGRSPNPLGDFWKYDFNLQTWSEMPTSAGMAARFGHTATVVAHKMYVHGGYLPDEDVLTDQLWSFDFTLSEWTLVGPRTTNFGEPYVADPSDAITFPGALAPERYSSVSIGAGRYLYVIGGAGGEDMATELGDLYKFDTMGKAWIAMDATGLNIYDAAGAAQGYHIAVFGGHGSAHGGDRKFHNDLYYYYTPEDLLMNL